MLSAAIMGATGAVGAELIKTLAERNFPCDSLKLLASSRSAGKKMKFRGQTIKVEELTEDSFAGVDIVFASAGGGISKRFVPAAVEAGAVVIDNSSAYRMDEGVPLVIPAVNGDALAGHKGILPVANCSTIVMVLPIAPIHRAVGIKRIVVSTYQAASGAGQPAMDELIEHTRLALDNKPLPPAKNFAHSLAFNCIPHVDDFLDNGYSKEEMKMAHETRKILEAPEMAITCTTVRVPTLRSHSESINIETHEKISIDEVRRLLAEAPAVTLQDDPTAGLYPLATTAAHTDDIFVGRIREDDSIENGINMWVVGDQLRKGAALTAIEIGEALIERDLLKPAGTKTT